MPMKPDRPTPTPWRWGKDWTDAAFGDPDDELNSGKKYADLALIGADDSQVIPLRIDHYKVEIDHGGTPETTIKAADRAFIVRAVNNHEGLLDVVRAAYLYTKKGVMTDAESDEWLRITHIPDLSDTILADFLREAIRKAEEG